MKRVVSEEEAARRLPELLEAACRGDEVVIERDGAELAAIVSPHAHHLLEQQRDEATAFIREFMREAHELNKDVPPEEIEADIAAAIAEVRASRADR